MAAQLTLTSVRSRRRLRVVDGAGEQFLARSGFAVDQHIGIRGRDRLHVLQHAPQSGAAADNLLEIVFRADFFFEVELFFFQPVLERLDLAKAQAFSTAIETCLAI